MKQCSFFVAIDYLYSAFTNSAEVYKHGKADSAGEKNFVGSFAELDKLLNVFAFTLPRQDIGIAFNNNDVD